MARNAKGNTMTKDIIDGLLEASRINSAPVWRDIAHRLEGPRRNWAEVNVSHISGHTKEGETCIVPGKVLGGGDIDTKVTVAGVSVSDAARRKIEAAGGKVMTLLDLARSNPKGSKVRIIG